MLFIFVYHLRSQSESTVRIGDQEWMVKNLTTNVFRNGDLIPEAKSREEWNKAGNESQPKVFCIFANTIDHLTINFLVV